MDSSRADRVTRVVDAETSDQTVDVEEHPEVEAQVRQPTHDYNLAHFFANRLCSTSNEQVGTVPYLVALGLQKLRMRLETPCTLPILPSLLFLMVSYQKLSPRFLSSVFTRAVLHCIECSGLHLHNGFGSSCVHDESP